jgi:hypothetical protein
VRLRKFHRFLGLVLFLLIFNSALTGILRANAKWWYWKDKPSYLSATALQVPGIGIERLFEITRSYFQKETPISRVELKQLLGKPVYLIEGQGKEKKFILIHANSGEVLSPIDAESATQIARQFVPEQTPLVVAEPIESYKARKATTARPAYRILFGDKAKTEVVLDRENGDVLALLDRGRRFGLWIVKLHELDFAGMSRNALTVFGLGIITLSLTGLSLANPLIGFKKKEKSYL